MFFSVLIPVYNTFEYLPDCVNSILVQSFNDYEIVLIDDGSNPVTHQLCDEYVRRDPRIRVIHKKNEGLMMTRRKGFQEAKGKYFVCIDSDDYFICDTALEKIHAFIETNDCDLVYYNYIINKKTLEKKVTLFPYQTTHVFEEKTEVYSTFLIGKFINNFFCKAISRDIVDINVDYSIWKSDICRGEDMFQSIPMLTNAKKVGFIPCEFTYYRWTPGSISNRPKLKFYYAYKTIYNRIDDYIDKWNVSDDVIEKHHQKRVAIILSIITGGYSRCKSEGTIKEWESFIIEISDDDFFRGLLDGCNLSKTLKYYQLLHKLVLKKRVHLLAFCIENVNRVSAFRHRGDKNAN